MRWSSPVRESILPIVRIANAQANLGTVGHTRSHPPTGSRREGADRAGSCFQRRRVPVLRRCSLVILRPGRVESCFQRRRVPVSASMLADDCPTGSCRIMFSVSTRACSAWMLAGDCPTGSCRIMFSASTRCLISRRRSPVTARLDRAGSYSRHRSAPDRLPVPPRTA